jgi:membrane glycosyltransferase
VRRLSEKREKMMNKVLHSDPSQLSEVEKWSLLNDPQLLSRLHQSLWSGEAIHPGWQVLVKAV